MRNVIGIVIGVTAVAIGMLAVASSAGAAAPATLHVRGTQTVVDEAAGTYRMHGSLVGAWATTAFTPTFESDTLFVGKGTERFNGCVDANRNGACGAAERHGVLRFSFVYWANYDAKTGAFLHGQCVHPVTGSSGGFAGASGLLLFDDTVHGDKVITTYKGQLQFGATAAAKAKAATRMTAAAASRKPTC